MEVFQGLRILSVELSGREVRADIYGGKDCVCGSVLYSMPDRGSASRRAGLLKRWARQATAVTYVRNGDSASLIDELSFLAAALAGAQDK